ncbi:hypothetical protein ACQEU3_47035 [Spirillospora sp. CA-253888]
MTDPTPFLTPAPDPAGYWRTGRKIPRNLYIHPTADHPDGVFIGCVDTPELAAHICAAVNAHNQQQETP